MKFVYGPKDLFENVGFQTEHWRHSESGTHVLVHLQFAETLIPDLKHRPVLRIFEYQSEEFDKLIQEEFTPKPEETPEDADENLEE